jgi:hypothetical protein
VTFGVDEGLQGQPELRWQFIFPERAEKEHRGLIGVKLRDAAGTALQVMVELPLDRRRELMFKVIRQQADDIAALASVFSHGSRMSDGPDAGCQSGSREPFRHSASSI